MASDDDEIRDLVAQWQQASRAGDTAAVLELMTEDAVFLIPGRAPMGKAEFAAAAQPPPGPRPTIAGTSDIKEIVVAGEWAFMWTALAVTVTPPGGGPPLARAGHTLSVLRKQGGRWRLARDANLLAAVAPKGG